MKKMIFKIRMIAFFKILLSLLAEILIVYVCLSAPDLAATIVCISLWSIVCLIYFINGVYTLKNGTEQLNEYIKKSNYTFKELDEEVKKSNNLYNVNIGDKHVFLITNKIISVIPINDIESLEIRLSGQNVLKGRPGYYYLYFNGKNIENFTKVYFATKNSVDQVVDALLNIKSNIKVEYN